jgi:hypothetical protein
MNEDIKEIIAEFNLDKPCRKREVVYKRYYLINILHCRSRLCLREIGELFNMNHSSVIHALNQHDRWWSQMDSEYLRSIHPLPLLVTDESRIPKNRYFDCETTEDSITIRGKFTKGMLKEFNKPLTKTDISLIFAHS